MFKKRTRDASPKFAVADLTAQFEPQVLDYIRRLDAGSVFYDLGACVGFFSLHAAARGLEVYAFEVEAKNFSALQQNLAVNRSMNLRAFQVGVSDGTSEWADLRNGQDRAGGHHKTLVLPEFAGAPVTVSDEYPIERVRVASLDAFVTQNQLPLPNHMKIDIDGSEVVFVRGARSVLASPQLKSLMFELYEDGPYYADLVREITNFGFSMTARHPIDQPWPGSERLFNTEFWR